MYEYFKGIISKITAKYIVLEVNSIGYILHVANPYAYSGHLHQEAKVYVHQVVREDAELLYGFATEEEKQLFDFVVSRAVMPLTDLLKIIRKNIAKEGKNALPNGLICLKGGELENEVMPVKNKTVITPLKDFFDEEFFETKKVVYVPV